MNDRQSHPADETLITLLDEPQAAAPGTAAHVEGCTVCRARVDGLVRLLTELGAEPPAPSGEELAAQRERIAAAVRDRPLAEARPLARRPIHRLWWAPLALAAAAAGLLLFTPFQSIPPDPPGGNRLPVVVHAERAAEEAFEAAVETGGQSGTAPLDEIAPILTEEEFAADFATLEADFAVLPAADQEAILDRLSTMTFEL